MSRHQTKDFRDILEQIDAASPFKSRELAEDFSRRMAKSLKSMGRQREELPQPTQAFEEIGQRLAQPFEEIAQRLTQPFEETAHRQIQSFEEMIRRMNQPVEEMLRQQAKFLEAVSRLISEVSKLTEIYDERAQELARLGEEIQTLHERLSSVGMEVTNGSTEGSYSQPDIGEMVSADTMSKIGRYVKAYLVKDLRKYHAWEENLDNLRKETAYNESGEVVEIEREGLNDDDILYLQENYVVTDGMIKDEHIIFDKVSDEWKEFCQMELEFRIPENESVTTEPADDLST